MTEYSYTLVVEDIEKSVVFYQQYFNWNADRKGKESAWINTKSPLVFSVVEKTYLYAGLEISGAVFLYLALRIRRRTFG